jgi:hypothetical protein
MPSRKADVEISPFVHRQANPFVIPVNTDHSSLQVCNNFAVNGFCHFGTNCKYSHKEQHDKMNYSFVEPSLNEKYKSQNCRMFYKEKYCIFGDRCHFRHDFRSFDKIHRHFYMIHIAALRLTAEELLEDSRMQPDGENIELNFQKELE